MNAPSSSPVSLAVQFLATRESDPALALQLAGQLACQVIDSPPASVPLSLQIELERILPLSDAAELQSTSVDTFIRDDKRRVAAGEPSQIVRLSERRLGVRLKHALRLTG